MAIVIESFEYATATTATASAGPVNKPASVATGDLLLILVVNSDSANTGPTFSAKTGWTKLFESGGTDPDANCAAYWRIADGTEPSTEEVETASADYWVIWYLRITGADVEFNAPFNQVAEASLFAGTSFKLAPGIAGTQSTHPGMTTIQPNSVVFALWGYDGADGTYNATSNSGTSWPTTIPTNQTLQSAGTTNGAGGGWLKTSALAEGTSTGVCTIGNSLSDGWCGAIFELAALGTNEISGTVTSDGATPVEGAAVTLFYADDVDGTNPVIRGTVYSDASGDWVAHFPEGKTAYAMSYWDDSGTKYMAAPQGFMTGV